MSDQPKATTRVVVSVESGTVVAVDCPEGVEVEVRDYDATDETVRLLKDDEGYFYTKAVWSNNSKG